ncbi:hypothetical protein D3C78_1771620 [compost metagenome]
MASRAEKPLRVSWHKVSTPPHSTASQMSRSSRRRALINAFALEVQAVEITYAGPLNWSQSARKLAGAPSSCWW